MELSYQRFVEITDWSHTAPLCRQVYRALVAEGIIEDGGEGPPPDDRPLPERVEALESAVKELQRQA